MNCEICCRRLLLCNTPQSLGCTPTVKCNVSHISYCYWNTEKLKCRNEQMRIVKEKALTTLFRMEMIINHKSHFSWWHEGAHMTVAARWGFKYYLMNQNTWSRPVLWNAAASTLVLSIFCCAEVAAAAGTPCLSASCEDESLTCLHICTVSQTSNHKGWKNGTHRTSYGFSDSSGGSFSLCVCVVEMWLNEEGRVCEEAVNDWPDSAGLLSGCFWAAVDLWTCILAHRQQQQLSKSVKRFVFRVNAGDTWM